MSTNSLCLTCLSIVSNGLVIPIPIAKFLKDVLQFEYALQEGLSHIICLPCYKTLCGIKRFCEQLEDVKHYFNQTSIGVPRKANNHNSTANPTQHINLRTMSDTQMQTTTENDGVFRCEKCSNRVFDDIELFRKHLQRHSSIENNGTANEKKFECKICDKTFITLMEMRSHCITHKNRKRYICNICPKTFRQKSGLSIHRFSHIERNVVCQAPGCGKRYTNIYSYKSHSKIHHEDSKVQEHHCDICSAMYGSLHELQNHKLSHNVQVECGICGKNVCQDNFKFHMGTEHSDIALLNEANEPVEFLKPEHEKSLFSHSGICLEEIILG